MVLLLPLENDSSEGNRFPEKKTATADYGGAAGSRSRHRMQISVWKQEPISNFQR